MGNASLFPFAAAGILVLGALMGSRLPAAQRDAAVRIFAIVVTVAAVAALLWLALRIHNFRLRPGAPGPIFIPLAIMAPALARFFVRRPRARRIFLALGGVMMIGFGFLFSHLLPAPGPVAALQIFRWAMVFCGAIMILAAWGNWLPPEQTEENEGALRPALGRPPRHFGEAS
jgi:hypothetical protein